ncbi:hypothetical protein HPB52_002019 [Rhipicephalus sanguineus]|uniref:Uncharacterized protein n=1 Tax=Rhipicephalus sanguineus TaxID=34632 RepID=A0A9D4SY75_RHISA|nr:hypothetical protein HPB52_002019 [Rhipicephalus sanguineus]
MPQLTKVHLEPNNFEKMRSSYAFQIFSSQSVRGIQQYRGRIEARCGNVEPTQKFFRMTSNQTRQWQPKHAQPSLVEVASQAGSRAHQLQGRAHSLEDVGLAHVAQLAWGVHQTAVLEKGLKSVADAVKEWCEIGRRQEARLQRLEENLSPLATLASTVVLLPQQPMPGQQPPQPSQ